MNRLIVAIIAGIAVFSGALTLAQTAGDDALPKGFKTTPVIKSALTRGGMKFAYPNTDKPEIVVVIGELEAGGQTALHQHPVPTVVYVLEGTITVQSQGGPAAEYKAGQAFVEDIKQTHQAFNKTRTAAKILVVYAGEEGKPTAIAVK